MEDPVSIQGAARTLCGIWQSPAVPAGSALHLPRPMPGCTVREGEYTVLRTHASCVTSHCAWKLPRMTTNPAPRRWPSFRNNFAYEHLSLHAFSKAVSINNQGAKRWLVQACALVTCTTSQLAGQRYTTQYYGSLRWCAMQGCAEPYQPIPKPHRTLNALQTLALMGFPPCCPQLDSVNGQLAGQPVLALRRSYAERKTASYHRNLHCRAI